MKEIKVRQIVDRTIRVNEENSRYCDTSCPFFSDNFRHWAPYCSLNLSIKTFNEVRRLAVDVTGFLRSEFCLNCETVLSEPSPETIEKHALQSTQALERVAKTLAKPGIKLRHIKDVPYFRADPSVPGQVIRTLNGHKASGTFDAKGYFVPKTPKV